MVEAWRIVPKIVLGGLKFVVQHTSDVHSESVLWKEYSSDEFDSILAAKKAGLVFFGSRSRFEPWVPV